VLPSRKRLTRAALAVVDGGPVIAWNAYRAKRLGATQKLRELAKFGRFLRGREMGTVVELGSERGGTLWMWSALAASDALIISVDLDRPSVLPARGSQIVEFVQGNSHDRSTRARVEQVLQGKPIDLLFIDADHGYESVRADYELFAPLVRPGGVIGFHDILTPHPSEVGRYWNELKRENRHRAREFVDHRDVRSRGRGAWGGIGVLQVES
jgi:predicted O-methyltransferase YrrM